MIQVHCPKNFSHMLFWTSGDQCSRMEHPLTPCKMFKIKDLKRGEIVAASLAQGGPPPLFLAESVYELMLTPEVNNDQLDAETHFTPMDKELFEQIRNCHTYDGSLRDLILDHGYTGP